MPEDQEVVLQRIDDWRRRLIDLTYRNRLIRYRPTKASTLEIAAPAVADLLEDPDRIAPWSFYFPPDEEEDREESDTASLLDEIVVSASQTSPHAPRADEIVARNQTNPRRINRILENLARKSNADFQDKALRILYIAAGFLDWVDPTRDERLTSPLLLVPVELRRESAGQPHRLHFVDDEDIVVNPSLTEKLRRDVHLEIPGEWSWEAKPIDVELDEIQAAVAGKGWEVRHEAVLGLFSFQKFVMYRDLFDNEEIIASHPLVRSLAVKALSEELADLDHEIPSLEELDNMQPPEDDFSILDADSTQRLCIEAARRGQSFVMQGPPGTGKSQTIANIISDFIGRGQRVLFVSEKAAALDVVHKRLAAQGLDEFCLLLHGEHASRREVVESLHRSLTGSPVPRRGMTSDEFERLTQLREMLNSTAQIVHLPMEELGDRSLWDILGELSQLHQAPSVSSAPAATGTTGKDVRAELQQLDAIFQRLADRWAVSPRSFVWRDFESDRFTADEHARVVGRVNDAREATTSLVNSADAVARLLGWSVPMNARGVERLLTLGRHVEVTPRLVEHWLVPGQADRIDEMAKEAEGAFAQVAGKRAALAEMYPTREARDFQAELVAGFGERTRWLAKLMGRTESWETALLPALPELRRFLRRSSVLIEEIEAAGSEAARLFGQPEDELTLERARELAELVDIAFHGEHRPERDWLVRAGFDRAARALVRVREKIQQFQAERARLFQTYKPESLEQDLTLLHSRFASEYTSRLSRLGPPYRRDAKLVRSLRHDGKLPKESVVGELSELAALQASRVEIDAQRQRLDLAWGSYQRGGDTDLTALDEALAAAKRVGELAAASSDLQKLGDQVSVGTEAEPHVAQLSDRLSEAIEEVSAGLDSLRPYATVVSQGLERETLGALGAQLEELRAGLESVSAVVAEFEIETTIPVEGLSDIERRVKLVRDIRQLEEDVAECQPVWRTTLDYLYHGEETDWLAAADIHSWLASFERIVAGALPPPLKTTLLDASPRWPDFSGLRAALDEYRQAMGFLTSLFEGDRRAELGALVEQKEFAEVLRLCDELELRIDDLYDWAEFRSWRHKARKEGWGKFVAALISSEVSAQGIVPAFRRTFWTRRLEVLFEKDPGLADRGAAYARWIDDFQKLDRKLVATAADRVIAARSSQRTQYVNVPGSQVSVVLGEAAKKRRHRPVRVLLAGIPTLLSEIKPCLMMSPLTVSHFLSPNHEFDLVLFDEASQVPPQDAINCIYRGKQMVVAGDSRQLPPTPFFQVAEADEGWDEESDTTEDMESILDACEALLPRHPLRWHYRSHHEELIAFSNMSVYGGTLFTFPSPHAVAETNGVRFIHVPDGVYDRGRTGTNRREAEVVAERVVAHLRAGRHSVGVIAFNTHQATAIDEELERLRIENPELEEHFSGDRLDAVFVKHLESVQGDERDVIVFSVGYGPDPDGRFTMNFGPLNKDGGYRRLNVAVTRGRDLVELVSSVRAADFSLSEGAGRGPRLLRDYIRYAETEGISLAPDAGNARIHDRSKLQEAIGDAVLELGAEADFGVGTGPYRVDIGVRSRAEANYILALETDGPAYSSTPTARDRDRLRDEVLRGLKWRIHRVWALDWVRNRQREFERLGEVIRETPKPRPTRKGSTRSPRKRADLLVTDLTEAIDSTDLPWVVEYKRLGLPSQNTFYEFHETINRQRQRDLLIKLLEVEAPVHSEYAIRRLARAWGLKRTSGRIVRAGRQAIGMAERVKAAERRGEFIWLPGQEISVVRSPRWDDERTFRAIHEIPPEEIDLAFTKLLEASGGAPTEFLIAKVAKVLGFDRVGGTIRSVLSSRLQELALESSDNE